MLALALFTLAFNNDPSQGKTCPDFKGLINTSIHKSFDLDHTFGFSLLIRHYNKWGKN